MARHAQLLSPDLTVEALINARAYAYDPGRRTYRRTGGVVIDGGRIVSLNPADAGAGISRVDLDGATLLPAFADCHVHLTDTGYLTGTRKLGGTRSYEEYCAALAAMAPQRILFAGNYDESSWRDGAVADAAPLERLFPDAHALLTRIDGHSCIVNRKTFAWLGLAADTQGIERDRAGEPTGKLFLTANWAAQSAFLASLPESMKRGAERDATALALSRGALHLHVQLVGFARERYAVEIAALRDLPPAKWYPKICEPDAALASELGLPFVGGDVFLDGSIGSCTAAVTAPFTTPASGVAPGNGTLTYSDDELYAYFSQAHSLGISAGVHAIGDRAIEQCIATWERVLGTAPPKDRHFIEHFEIARQDHIERCARLGIYLSMQPQFDELWGGPGNMYDARLGTERMRTMNALGRAQRAGAVLCGGDDSPVCDLNPLRGMHAAVHHHEPSEALSPYEALAMYTHNAARLGHAETDTGALHPGLAADFAVLDRDPLEDGDFLAACVLQTWRDGEMVFEKT